MKMEMLKSGCLKVMLSDRELAAAGLSYDTLDRRKPATRAALRRLLLLAREQVSFPAERAITVESIPLDGGCLLLISPMATVKKRHDGMTPRLYFTADCSPLFDLAAAAEAYGSLYRFGEGFYLLIFGGTPRFFALAEEFLTPFGNDPLLLAQIEEHGRLLCAGDAVWRLREALTSIGWKPPAPPDPRH